MNNRIAFFIMSLVISSFYLVISRIYQAFQIEKQNGSYIKIFIHVVARITGDGYSSRWECKNQILHRIVVMKSLYLRKFYIPNQHSFSFSKAFCIHIEIASIMHGLAATMSPPCG